MKLVKFFLFSFLLLLVVPFANAELGLYDFSNKVYSLGDVALFSGYVTYSNDTMASLNINLNCGGNSQQVAVESLDLKANEKTEFSSYVNLPFDTYGNCTVSLNLIDTLGNTLEAKDYQGFELSNSLDANFEISKSDFQLGELLTLNGFVKKPNGGNVDGIAIISFKQNDVTKFLGKGEIVKGAFNYSKELIRIPAGEYKITISARDNFGNSKNFVDALIVNIKSVLDITTNIQKSSYNPGDTLIINGYVSSNLGAKLSDVSLEFDFGDNQKVYQKISNSNTPFSVSYPIPNKVKTKTYTVGVTAKNKLGNYGYKTFEYSVNAIPTSLDLNLESTSYDPEEDIKFNIQLLDQASDSMQENINVNLLNLDNKVISNSIIATNSNSSIKLPAQAEPGNWKLAVSAFGLEDSALLNVKQYKQLEAHLEGTEVVINNTGNIKVKEILPIEAGNLIESKDISLDVGESKRIKLEKVFPPGSYQVKLPTIGTVFDNVILAAKKSSLFGGLGKLTGNVTKNINSSSKKGLLFVALILLGASLIYLVIGRRKNNESKRYDIKATDKDYILGKKKLEELKAKGIRKDTPTYGKATQEDVDYWKKKVQETFREQEQQKSSSEFVNRQQKSMDEDKPKPGLFNMFG